jgi:hypothetical protein
MSSNQVFGYDVITGEKRTSDSPWSGTFLNSLPIGTTVWRESSEWDASRGCFVDVMAPIGTVAKGEFGNLFKNSTDMEG